MATITKRFNRDGAHIGWHVKVRRHGFPPKSKTFKREADAKVWARAIESEMDKGAFVDRSLAERTTHGDAIAHFGQTYVDFASVERVVPVGPRFPIG